MAWTCVGTSAVVEATTTSITLAEPAGVADGDLLVACFASRSTATTAITGTGWSAVASQNNNNVVSNATTSVGSATMLYRVRSGAPTLAFTIPTGNSVTFGRMLAYRGNTATPLDVTSGATTGTNVTAVSVAGMTTTQADDLIVTAIGSGRNSLMSAFNATSPSGASGTTTASGTVNATWTERADSGSNTTPRGALGIFDATKAAAGATGNFTATMATAGGHAVVGGSFKMQPPAPVTGVKVYTGAGWAEKPVKRWTGSAWVPKQTKYWTGTIWKNAGVTIGGGGYSAETQQFLDRTTGLSDTRKAIYNTYINALVSGGVWAKLHYHYILQAPKVDVAVTNLKSSSFTGRPMGSPGFQTNVGMQGIEQADYVYINTQYVASANTTSTDCHLSAWNNTNNTYVGPITGSLSSGSVNELYPKYIDNNSYYWLACNGSGGSLAGPADPRGLFVASRNASVQESYFNAGAVAASSPTQSSLSTNTLYVLGDNNSGTPRSTGYQALAASAGLYLTAAQVASFHAAQATLYSSIAADSALTAGVVRVGFATGSRAQVSGTVYNFGVIPMPVAGVAVIHFSMEAQSTADITFTVSGNAATPIIASETALPYHSRIFYISIPTAGNYNFSATANGGSTFGVIGIAVLQNAAAAPTGSTMSAGAPVAFTPLNIPANGIGLAQVMYPRHNGTQFPFAWTGCDSTVGHIENWLTAGGYAPIILGNYRYGGASGVTSFNPGLAPAPTGIWANFNFLVSWGPA